MSILAFLVTVIYIPGFLGASIQPGWALMSSTLPLALWTRHPSSLPRWVQLLGVGLIAYALLSISWSPNRYLAIGALWQQGCVVFAFLVGAGMSGTGRLVKGLALGLSVTSLLTVTQAFGIHSVIEYEPGRYGGLLFNPVASSMSIAVVVIWLVAKREWWFIPALLPGLYLAHSRGAYAILAFVALVWLSRLTWLAGLGLIVLAGICISSALGTGTEDAWRISLWVQTIRHLTPWGWGPGAMDSIFLNTSIGLVSPENAHNEYLDLAYQYGIPSLAVWAIVFPALRRFNSPEFWPLIACLAAALFSFPLHIPVLAFASAICVGRLYSDRPVAWREFAYSGYGFLHRLDQWRRQSDRTRRAAVSI